MKTKISVNIAEGQIEMRSIELRDIEHLRLWKNSHKEFFFNKNEISTIDQFNWFSQFIEKKDDHMFIIENENSEIGCIGARILNNFVDVYNVILGDKSFKGKHIMTYAMEALIAICNLLYVDKPVFVKVLKSNPAINWYMKLGFVKIDDAEDYIQMEYNNSTVKNKYCFKIEIELPNF